MRFVLRTANSCPTALRPAAVAADLKRIVQSGNKKLVDSDRYRIPYRNNEGTLCSVTLDTLARFYEHKCAYCERRATLYVEHYRPVGGQSGQHRRYLWLCYEWTNMVPACHDCNSVAGAKGTKFPVAGSRQVAAPLLPNGCVDPARSALTSTYLISEQPVLLHPEIDQPTNFLTVRPTRRRDGYRLLGIDPQQRGTQTISICQLNRKSLQLDRLTIVQNMANSIQLAYDWLTSSQVTPEQFPQLLAAIFRQWDQAAADDKLSLTLVRRVAVSSPALFRQVVVPLLLKSQVKLVTQAFAAYKAGTLHPLP